MRLVENQRVILAEPGVALRFGEQNAVGHQLDVRILRRAIAEADFVADVTAEFAVQFLRDACRRGARSDTARLRMADQAGNAAPEFKTNLGNLRRFARTRFATDDDHRMLFDQRRDLRAPYIDRKIVSKFRFGQALTTKRDCRTGFLKRLVVLDLQGVAFGAEEVTQIARHRAQPALVNGETILEFGFAFQWQLNGKGSTDIVTGL